MLNGSALLLAAFVGVTASWLVVGIVGVAIYRRKQR
jgi:hypothetical protein